MADLPALEDVAVLLASRTKGEFVELGTFTVDTKPTAVQVTTLIARAARQVYLAVGAWADLPNADLQATAVDLVALRASLWVELSYFPEQAAPENSPYRLLLDAFKDDLAALVDGVAEAAQTVGGESVAGNAGIASGWFPSSADGIGLGTEW